MHQSEYQLIAGHALRNVLRNVCNDPRDLPGRKELRADLEAALPDAEANVIDALMVKAEEFASAAVEPGARWDLRASADALTLHVLKAYQAADRLVPLAEDTTDEDVTAALEHITGFDPTQRPRTPADIAARQAADIENARLLGGYSS